MRNRWRWLAGGVIAVVVGVSLVTFVYIHVVQGPAPAKLSLADTGSGKGTTTTGAATGAATGADASGPIAGTWRPTAGSVVGYRVKEVLFGQSAEAVGRTSKVTGTMTIDGTTVSSVDLSADMTSVSSDRTQRDNQYRGRIMDVSSFPTATFTLKSPVALGSLPAGGTTVSVKATGELTLRGTTKPVTVDLQGQRSGTQIKVSGSIPITFADWGIPNPTFGPVSTEDHGILELLVVFERAS